MRKNPYNKNLKDQLPLFMQGPSTTTALTKNEEQKIVLEKTIVSTIHKYEVNNVSFTMMRPPILNQNGTFNPQDILNVEMGRTEVTQELFEVVMGWNKSRHKNSPQNPVEWVSWYDCISFCNKLSELLGFQPCYEMIGRVKVLWNERADGFRLPTEAEWESFAKAGTQNQWSGTNVASELGKYALYTMTSKYKTHPVGEKLPNEWGLYDMTGNVLEWCWDKYDATRFNNTRVLRGGSFWDDEDSCRISHRDNGYESFQSDGWGFRICRKIK